MTFYIGKRNTDFNRHNPSRKNRKSSNAVGSTTYYPRIPVYVEVIQRYPFLRFFIKLTKLELMTALLYGVGVKFQADGYVLIECSGYIFLKLNDFTNYSLSFR